MEKGYAFIFKSYNDMPLHVAYKDTSTHNLHTPPCGDTKYKLLKYFLGTITIPLLSTNSREYIISKFSNTNT